jgi:hypothetical protein
LQRQQVLRFSPRKCAVSRFNCVLEIRFDRNEAVKKITLTIPHRIGGKFKYAQHDALFDIGLGPDRIGLGWRDIPYRRDRDRNPLGASIDRYDAPRSRLLHHPKYWYRS